MSIYPGVLEAEVRVHGERVPFVDSQTARDPGAPMVLIHGSGGTAAAHYGALYPMFANRRRVIALDYGDPEAGTQPDLSVEFLADKVIAVLDATAGQIPVDVVGYSLGAAVALTVAAAQPDRIRTVTTIGGWLRSDEHQRLRNAVWQHLYSTDAPQLAEFGVLNAYGAPYLSRRSPAEVKALVQRSRPGPDRARQMQLNASLDVVDIATRVSAPTLVVGALHDQIAPIHHSRQILGAVPDARLATVNSGHAVLTERPAEVYQLIDDFTNAPGAHPSGSTIPAIVV